MQIQTLGFDAVQTVDLTKPFDAAQITDSANPFFTNFGLDIPSADFAAAYAAAVENVQNLADACDGITLMPGRCSLLRSAKAIADFLEKVGFSIYLLL